MKKMYLIFDDEHHKELTEEKKALSKDMNKRLNWEEFIVLKCLK